MSVRPQGHISIWAGNNSLDGRNTIGKQEKNWSNLCDMVATPENEYRWVIALVVTM